MLSAPGGGRFSIPDRSQRRSHQACGKRFRPGAVARPRRASLPTAFIRCSDGGYGVRSTAGGAYLTPEPADADALDVYAREEGLPAARPPARLLLDGRRVRCHPERISSRRRGVGWPPWRPRRTASSASCEQRTPPTRRPTWSAGNGRRGSSDRGARTRARVSSPVRMVASRRACPTEHGEAGAWGRVSRRVLAAGSHRISPRSRCGSGPGSRPRGVRSCAHWRRPRRPG